MSELRPPPGFGSREAPFAKEHITYQRREARRDKWVARGSLALNVMLGGALIAAAYGAAFVLPLVRMVPVFVPIMPDGTVQASVTADQQPPDLYHRQVQAWLWQYVLNHDSYSYGAAFLNRDIVCGMSVEAVCKAYKAYSDSKNPNSMINKLGRNGWVRLVPDNLNGELRFKNDGTGSYRLSYWRVQEEIGRPAIMSHWRQDIEFTQDYAVPVLAGKTYNPMAITITDYPPPEPIGAPPSVPTTVSAVP